MTTLISLATQILTNIGVIAPGQPIDAGEMQGVVTALNVMVDSWDAEGFMIYASTRESFTLTPALGTYDWGSTAVAPNFTTVRPIRILKVFVRDGSNDYPVDIIGEDEYEDITSKDDQGRPEKLFYNPTYPLGKVFLYYVPDASYILHIDSEKDLIDFSTLTATISLPPEYIAALKWNGIVEMCTVYQRQPTPIMLKRADETIRILRRINAANKAEPVFLDLFTVRKGTGGNIITGTN